MTCDSKLVLIYVISLVDVPYGTMMRNNNNNNNNNNNSNNNNNIIYFIVIRFFPGPCGGKTTGQARLCTFFENLGWKVFRVPEAANILLG